MAQQAGKGVEESKKPKCTYSPAFLEKVTNNGSWPESGTLTAPHAKSQLHLLGPYIFWLVPLEPAVILSFERGQVWSLAQDRREGRWPQPRGPTRWARASIPIPNIATSPVQSLRYQFFFKYLFLPSLPNPIGIPQYFFYFFFFLFLFFAKLILSLSCHKITSENTTSLQKKSRMTRTLRKTHFYGLWKHL